MTAILVYSKMLVFEQDHPFLGHSAALYKGISFFHLLTLYGAPHGLPHREVLLLAPVLAKLGQFASQGPINPPSGTC